MQTRLTLAAIGLVQGFIYYLAYEYWPDEPTSVALFEAAIFFVTGTALIVQLSWTGTNIKRQISIAPVVSIIFALVAFWVWRQIPTGEVPYHFDDTRAPTWIFGSVLTLLLIMPCIQIFQSSGVRSFPYDQLFRRLWENLFVIAIAALIVGAFWAVIWLWSELFKLIDVSFFEDVFTDAAFVSMSLTTVFGYALALGREWERVTTTLRAVLLTVLKALMPLLAVVALLFLASLPFTGLQPLWDTRHASATLLSLIGLTILFFNGAYQDGTGDAPYQRWVRHLVEAALVAIPAFAAIALYALHLRMAQYGLTFGRFYGVLFAVAGMLCGIGYAIAVFLRRGTWMAAVRQVNVGMACLVAICAILVHTPVLDPLGWSARSQFSRLAAGKADALEFDYGYLRFEAGHLGYEKLAELETLSEHPQAQIIRARIAETRAAESYRDVRPQPASLLSASDIVPLDTATILPDSLVRFAVSHLSQAQADECEEKHDCTMFAANLDADEEQEYVLVLSGDRFYDMLVFDRGERGEWKQAGQLRTYGGRARLPLRALLFDTLRQQGPIAAEPQYRDLLVGGLRLRVTP
jgi:hypothetical protein